MHTHGWVGVYAPGRHILKSATVLYCTVLEEFGALEQPSGSVLHNASRTHSNVKYSIV